MTVCHKCGRKRAPKEPSDTWALFYEAPTYAERNLCPDCRVGYFDERQQKK